MDREHNSTGCDGGQLGRDGACRPAKAGEQHHCHPHLLQSKNSPGVAIAGILYPIWSISAMVALDVIGAIIASLSVIAIKVPNLNSTEKIKNSNNFGEDVKTGYSVLKKETGIFALVWVAAVFTILYFPINALFPLISLDYFGGTTFQASIAEIAFSVGMLVGGIILGFWGGIKNRGIGIPLSILLMGVSIALSGMLPS